jgi:hypothetical protein
MQRSSDHTDRALDILLHKVVIKEDYGSRLYREHCARCHGPDRRGKGDVPELSERSLERYRTLDDLWHRIREGCPGSDAGSFQKLGAIRLIFISRHIKRPLPEKP